jgi:PAS domain S-box-containing protein
MCITTLQGQLVFMNAAFQRLFGYTSEEITQLTFRDLMSAEDYDATLKALATMAEGKPLIDFVNLYRVKSGETRWLSWTATPQPDGFVYAVVHDVTREKQLEEQLKNQTRSLNQKVQQLEAVLDSQIDLISLHTLDTTLLFVNDAYCNYFGKSREELIGKSFLQFVAPDNHAAIWQRVEDIKRYASPGVMITDNLDSKGQRRTIQWADNVITDENGAILMIQSIGRDITRLMEVESELESKERQYRLMFEYNPMPMCVFVPQTMGFLAANDAFIKRYGYSMDELKTMTIKDLHPPEDLADLMAYAEIERTREKRPFGQDMRKEDFWRHQTKSGEIMDVEIHSHDIIFDGQQVRLVLMIDVTERKQLERERLSQQKRGLESEKERELQEQSERFFGMVAHEFKTPLSVILSAAQLVRDYYSRMSPSQILQRIDIISEQARETVEMIEEFLAVAPSQNREITPQFETVELDMVCRAVIHNVSLADNNQHPIILNAETTTLDADPKMIRQVITNLISNAVKYSPLGSVVQVSLTAEPEKLHLIVQDNGIGIPPEEQTRIFQPFIRGSNARNISGTGLGLAIVQQNVTAHGGTLDVESRAGEGTRITVHLPRKHTAPDS